ncbi:hypothetical protein AGMMS49991_08960 [Spirochaetia bacterium]|nr:hypothetical protein AGMMS49991_08960 [Spirochaetia bacterium]
MLLRVTDTDTNAALLTGFDPDTAGYAITVPDTTTQLTVSAETADGKALAIFQETVHLVYETTPIVITVIAENGTKQEYTVTVTLNGKAVNPDPGLPPELSAFRFETSNNPGLPSDLLSSVYDETKLRYTFSTSAWIDNIDKLKASFTATGEVTVNTAAQVSGVTANDFRHDVVYTVSSGGTAKVYTIRFKSPQASGLPVIKIDTQGKAAIHKTDYVKTNIAITDPDNPGYSFENVGYGDEIRGRGNSTWTHPKKPYRLKFNKKTALFGEEAAKSWVLLANWLDPTFIMNTVTFELGRRIGLPYTNHAHHVELFLNGDYQGSYVLTEHMQTGKGRVNIDEKDGYLVEVDNHYDEDPKFIANRWDEMKIMIKTPEDLTDPAGYDFVKNSINDLAERLYNRSFTGSADYKNLIDMDTFVDYLLICEVVFKHEIHEIQSVFMYKDKGGKISMGPLWDFDWDFGYSLNGSNRVYFNWPKERLFPGGTPSNTIHFFDRFFEDPVFRTQYKAHWNANYAKITGMTAFIDEMASLLAESQSCNSEKWGDASVDYAGEITKMKNWWTTRVGYLNTEINR